MKTNLKTIAIIIVGLVIGVAITLFTIWQSASDVMMVEDVSPYDFTVTTAKLEETVVKEGWKIATVHDLQKTMQKFNKEVLPVKVFEICQPDHAEKILKQNEERVVSSLMPCRIAIYEKKDGKTYISRMNTSLLGKMMDGVVPEVMDEASAQSENIIKKVLE